MPPAAPSREATHRGLGVSGGVAIGRALVLGESITEPDRRTIAPDAIAAEIHRLTEALGATRRDLTEIQRRVSQAMGAEEAGIFDAHLLVLEDPMLLQQVHRQIQEHHDNAEHAVHQTIGQYAEALAGVDDDYLRERATDIKDLCSRVLYYLQEQQKKQRVYPERCILVCEALSAAMLADVPKGQLVGVVSAEGSAHSHVAILAKAMGMPAVMGVADFPFAELDGHELIVDGHHGRVYSDPSEALRQRYQQIVREEVQLTEELEMLRELPCETRDGYRVALWVNTGLLTDVLRSRERGAEGIGLFRTEVPFMLRESFPTEDEQTEIYREQLQAFHPKQVTMRTLDIGGDKPLPYFPIDEANPFLGWRGIRVSMDHPELFLAQVRAMLRASVGLDNLQILLPMISHAGEIDSALLLIRRAQRELFEEGYAVRTPPIGVMIEVP
ncbi:MAG: phosphoenolpyruvate--protein phosphotransferase, partial [Verrucomicrobiota bacterium]